MKSISRIRYFIYLSLLFTGCTTGKNALQKGKYDAAVTKAVDRLKSSPKNNEAIQVLPSAYALAVKTHLQNVDNAKLANDVLRWETVMNEYNQLNQLSDAINSCPTCLTLVPNPQLFIAEAEDARNRAVAVRYDLGVRGLAENNRASAKKAYYNFERVNQLYPNYKDVQTKLDDAYWAAVLKVVVQPANVGNNPYRLSNDYFQQQINRFLADYRQNMFVKFYTEQQASANQIKPDQLLQLDFLDFIVGQTYVKERVEKLKKDSVLISDTRANGKKYGTVRATLSIFEKRVSSSGLLNVAFIDVATNGVVHSQRLPGTYIWQDSWATYKGDERALSKQQLMLTKKREMLPPTPTALFVEFTKPIYNQLVNEINSFYYSY